MTGFKTLPAVRSYLFAIAYNLLGEIQEAEDIVQDSLEAVLTQSLPDRIANEKAYLARIVANKSIDRLKQVKKNRRSYPGIWLPEPWIEPVEIQPEGAADILSYSLLCTVEQLNPTERAVFILREAFQFTYSELSVICGQSEMNCRQILSRARKKIKPMADHYKPEEFDFEALVDAFLLARNEADFAPLIRLLKEDMVVYSDGGGKRPAARWPISGREAVLKFMKGILSRPDFRQLIPNVIRVNGLPALLLSRDRLPDTLVYFEEDKKQVKTVYVIRNPEKINLVRLSQNV
ncbi:sigma-70 family RNA polymerase sigma factor [Larkinella sp. VNQ87]|uniref:sigma-70 family RNA polymerase sigma factor n=1 Tax=Larkinella sp. VNQ87 TaxID=3400921 RepID=UPI003C0B478A